MRVAVVGAGAWGTAFARVLRDRGHDVTLAPRDADQARAIAESGKNPRYLPDVTLDGIGAAPLAEAALGAAELVVLAVPSRSFGDVVPHEPPPMTTMFTRLRPSRRRCYSERWKSIETGTPWRSNR